MAHIAGGKFANGHTTAIEAAVPVLRAAEGLSTVSKIALGVITPGLHAGSRRSIKFTEVPSGLTAVVCGSTSKQILQIFTSDPKGTRTALHAAFYGNEWKDRPT